MHVGRYASTHLSTAPNGTSPSARYVVHVTGWWIRIAYGRSDRACRCATVVGIISCIGVDRGIVITTLTPNNCKTNDMEVDAGRFPR